MPINVTTTLRKALAELQTERDRVDGQITAIRRVLDAGGGPGRRRARRTRGPAAASAKRARKPMSAAARAAVARRVKAYWAKRKAAKKGK